MIRIYRVENAEGNGPYQGWSELAGELCASHNGCDAHPGPDKDRIPMYKLDCAHHDKRFGFTSVAQANLWFDGWFTRLHEAGFYLVQYKVPAPRTLRSTKQALFDRSAAKLVGRV